MKYKKTALYRHFDADDNLLYVGISLSSYERLSQHHSNSEWAEDAVMMTTEWYDNRNEALDAETIAIQTEMPAYNKAKSIYYSGEIDTLRMKVKLLAERNELLELDCSTLQYKKYQLEVAIRELQEQFDDDTAFYSAFTTPHDLYAMCCDYTREHSAQDKQRGRASHIFKSIMGDWPPREFDFDSTRSIPISRPVLNRIRSKNIAYSKRKR